MAASLILWCMVTIQDDSPRPGGTLVPPSFKVVVLESIERYAVHIGLLKFKLIEIKILKIQVLSHTGYISNTIEPHVASGYHFARI